MSSNENPLPNHHRPDGDQLNVVRNDDFVRWASINEGPVPARKRAWPRKVALAVAAATAVTAALLAVSDTTSSAPEHETAAPATTTAAPPPRASATSARAAERPMIPLSKAFPVHVADGNGGTFTRLGSAVLKSCTEPDSVGSALAAEIAAGSGCLGEEIALYKDTHNNQFNLAIFTMKDSQETVKLVTQLTMNFNDYEVAAQAPPPGSGLPTLPADSGMVQAFTGQGRAMVVGLGQWSDGRTSEYQKLVDRLEPLLKAVSKNVAGYETAN
ncbi:hypothetical protein JHN59_29185 [Streptomyces sp. MBT49]|uniref:hypothetical protein n=1 Tax=Streptomyces sp. MBT49 TaxID=1488380 RepID=UPI00190D6CDF|nr:hypothetical protein [Streptomyces sp. MBT49]MBK3628832.1 hypothetical protein [Streptomyces sp. MBT49]